MSQTGLDICNPKGSHLAEFLTASAEAEPAAVRLLENVETMLEVDPLLSSTLHF